MLDYFQILAMIYQILMVLASLRISHQPEPGQAIAMVRDVRSSNERHHQGRIFV